MNWFRRVTEDSDHGKKLSDEEKADMAAYAADPRGWTNKAKAKIANAHIDKLNQQTAEYYSSSDDDDDSSGGGDTYTPTDYSEYGDLSD